MKRLKEASTWAGFGVLLQAAAAFLPVQYQIFAHAGSAVAGALAGVIAEKGRATNPTGYPKMYSEN